MDVGEYDYEDSFTRRRGGDPASSSLIPLARCFLPAGAGVIPQSDVAKELFICFTRRRGGDPRCVRRELSIS